LHIDILALKQKQKWSSFGETPKKTAYIIYFCTIVNQALGFHKKNKLDQEGVYREPDTQIPEIRAFVDRA
jgi:hypothetical protein